MVRVVVRGLALDPIQHQKHITGHNCELPCLKLIDSLKRVADQAAFCEGSRDTRLNVTFTPSS